MTLYARLESGEGETKRDEKGGGCAEELEAEGKAEARRNSGPPLTSRWNGTGTP